MKSSSPAFFSCQQSLVGRQDLGSFVLVQLLVGPHEGSHSLQVDPPSCEGAQLVGQPHLGVLVGTLLPLQNPPNLLCGHGHGGGKGLLRFGEGCQSLGNPCRQTA